MSVNEVRQVNGYDADAVSLETGLACRDLSLTQQSQREEADINTLVRRFGMDGAMPVNVKAPMYGDFTRVFDFQSALEAVREAEASFMAMPPRVRSRFENNPQLFVEFCSDPQNAAELKELGLVRVVEAPAAPLKVEVVANSVPATGAAGTPGAQSST